MRITNQPRLIPLLFCFRLSLATLKRLCPRSSDLTVAALFALSWLIPGFATGQSPEQDIESSFRAGQAALRQGDFVRATEEFKRVLALDPSLTEAEVNLGL